MQKLNDAVSIFQKWMDLSKNKEFSLYHYLEYMLLFDEIDIFDIMITDFKIEDINSRLTIDKVAKIERKGMKFDDAFILWLNAYYIKNILLNQLQYQKLSMNSYLAMTSFDFEKVNNKKEYKLVFVFGEIKLIDFEIEIQSIIKYLKEFGDTEEEIKKRNFGFSIYKYCKLREKNELQ